jgi:hypothetical protein
VKGKAISEKVAVPGVRPVGFKLVEKAADSYDLYRSSRKFGTARVEPMGDWTARFEAPGGEFTAAAQSAPDLLRLVGAYLLLGDARKEAEKPVEESRPELRVGKKATAEEKLSLEFARRAQKRRIAELDDTLEELRKRIKRAKKA